MNGLPLELYGLGFFKNIVPYAFRQETMQNVTNALDEVIIDMLRGINSQQKLLKLAGINLLSDPKVCLIKQCWFSGVFY